MLKRAHKEVPNEDRRICAMAALRTTIMELINRVASRDAYNSYMFDSLPHDAQKQIRRSPMPKWRNPMLATLTREPFSDPDWIFETKLDGIRCLAFRKSSDINLYSRNQLNLNDAYPDLIGGLLKGGPQN